MTKHLCPDCSLANWARTKSGRLHPLGDGRCQWQMPIIQIPPVYTWGLSGQPKLNGGYINRHIKGQYAEPVGDCSQFKARVPVNPAPPCCQPEAKTDE